MITKEETAVKLTELFPEKAVALAQHYAAYNGQLLGHIFLLMKLMFLCLSCSRAIAISQSFANTVLLLRRCTMTGMKMLKMWWMLQF